MSTWIGELTEIFSRGETASIVTVAGVRGSTPRNAGAKMIVTTRHSYSTIGGGQLEFQCTRLACEQLSDDEQAETSMRKFTLGSNCGQCCGGVAEVLFEPVSRDTSPWLDRLADLYASRTAAAVVTAVDGRGKFIITADSSESFANAAGAQQSLIELAREALRDRVDAHTVSVKDDAGHERRYMIETVTNSNFNMAIFGAGHVGAATVAAMAKLDCNIRWIDSRRGIFPSFAAANVTAIETEQPALEVSAMPPKSFFLVMTHSHALDFEICDRILRRRDFAYCGLIGSRSKRRRFERLMRQQNMPASLLERLTCPIGISGIVGKQPEEIAIAVSAQLLQLQSVNAEIDSGDTANVHYF